MMEQGDNEIMREIRKQFRRPLKVLRGRQREIEKLRDDLRDREQKIIEKEQLLSGHSQIGASPLMAINLLAVEALFLLEKRAGVRKPKHYRIIKSALQVVEKMTMNDMGKKYREIIYNPLNDDAVLATVKKLREE
jgi:hypothetical protein